MKHEIHIGDSRNVLPQLNKETDLVVTSPPYFVGKDYGDSYKDEGDYQQYLNMIKEVFQKCYDSMKKHRYICVNVGRETGKNTSAHYAKILENIGFNYQNLVIWKKPEGAANQTFTQGLYPYARYYEPKLVTEQILVYSKDKINKHRGERTEESKINSDVLDKFNTNVWEMNPNNSSDHPAPFPVKLPELCIQFYTKPGETILDPFLGGGTSMQAATQLGRSSIGIELEEKYLDMIKKNISFGQQKLGSKLEYEVKNHYEN